MVCQLGVRQALEEGQRDRLLLPLLERFDARPHRASVCAGQQHLQRSRILGRDRQTFVLIVHGDRLDLAPTQLIQTAVADDAGEPCQRLTFCGDVRARVVPDIDEAFLQDLKITRKIPSGSAIKLCRVAEGIVDVYPRLAPVSEWDVAAGDAIITSAGGAVSTPGGEPLAYGRSDQRFIVPGFVAFGDQKASSRLLRSA